MRMSEHNAGEPLHGLNEQLLTVLFGCSACSAAGKGSVGPVLADVGLIIHVGMNSKIGLVTRFAMGYRRAVSVRSGRGMGPVKRISHVEARPHKVLSFCW